MLLIAYLLGSIPSAVWIGKLFYNTDVREFGSGNAGATNTLRVLGKRPALLVFAFDLLKGFIACYLPVWMIIGADHYVIINWQIFAGLAAVIGHIYPVFADFRGGKGIATLLGITIALQLDASLICFALFLIVLFFSKFVSLGSILAALSFPIYIIGIDGSNHLLTILFAVLIPLLVISTHQKNIKRLIDRNENKTYLFQKKNSPE
jgi:glycerol-3-phosphate acyltransferase PlsY